MSEASTYQALRGHLATLRLGAAAEALPAELDAARAKGSTHTAFLERLLAVEVAATVSRRQASLARFACLPAPWRIADFDFDAQPSVDRKLVEELASLRFLEDATNVLLIGPPGVGKTMLAVGLGWAAVEAGYRVHYTTAADLAARCHRAALEGRWASMMRFYAGPRLLIVDLCRGRDYADNPRRRSGQPCGGGLLAAGGFGMVGIVTSFRGRRGADLAGDSVRAAPRRERRERAPVL